MEELPHVRSWNTGVPLDGILLPTEENDCKGVRGRGSEQDYWVMLSDSLDMPAVPPSFYNDLMSPSGVSLQGSAGALPQEKASCPGFFPYLLKTYDRFVGGVQTVLQAYTPPKTVLYREDKAA